MKRKIRKWVKWFLIFLASIVCLVLALVIFLHTSWGRSIVRNKVEKYLRNKLQTTVSIGKIDYSLLSWIQLKNVIILDHRNDTLLRGGSLYVKLNVLKLLSQNVEIDGIKLENIHLNIGREAGDSTYNFQFIADAFSSPPTKVDRTSISKPMQLSVNYILLSDVHFSFNDKKEKKYFSADLHHFYCSPHQLDLEKSFYKINDLVASNFQVNIVDSSSTINTDNDKQPMAGEKTESTPYPFLFTLKKFGLRNITFSYKKPLAKMDISVSLDSLQLDETAIDLQNNSVSGQKFTLTNSVIKFFNWTAVKTPAKDEEVIQQVAADKGWEISIEDVALSNNSFIYHNQAMPAVNGLDYNHIVAKEINLSCKQNKFNDGGFSTEIENFSTVVNDHLNLKSLKTIATYTDSALSIKNLALAFNESNLNSTGNLVWQLKPVTKSNTENIHCSFHNSTISYADVLQIQPGLQKELPISLSPTEKIFISGNLNGSLQDFVLDDFKINTSSNTFQFSGNAALKNGDRNLLTYAATIDQLQVQKKLLSPDLLWQLEKEQINLPAKLLISGKLNGTSHDASADLKLNSDYGILNVKGFIKNIDRVEGLQYDLSLDAINLETGKWINQDSLFGKLTGKIFIKGNGINTKKLVAASNLQLKSVAINGYDYSNVELEAGMIASDFSLKGQIGDPNLATTIDIRGNIAHKYPAADGYIDIDHADLRKLHFLDDSIVLSSKIKINSIRNDSSNFHATILLDSSVVTFNGKTISVDSLLLRGYSEKNRGLISFSSPFLNAELNTNYPLSQLSYEAENISSQVSALQISPQNSGGNHRVAINGSINNHELLTKFFPDIKLSKPVKFTAGYDGEKKDSFFFLKLNAPSFSYGKMEVDQLDIHAHNIDSVLEFTVHANNIHSGADSIFQPSIEGVFQNKLLTLSANAEDNKGERKHAVKLSMLITKESTDFRLIGDLVFDRNKWEVPADNRVVIRKDGFIVNNLSLSNRGQTIYIASKDPQRISPIDIRIDSFEIADVLRILSMGDTLASGKLSADITIQQPVNKFPLVAGTIGIKQAAIKNIPVGDLQIFSETKGDSLQVSGTLSGKTEANFDGSINATTDNMRLGLQLKNVDVNLIQQFAKEYISRTAGNCSAELIFSGTTKDPKWNGKIDFDSVSFAINDLFALYKIDRQSIAIDYPDIRFNQFTLSDSLNNKLVVDGKIKVISPDEYGLDLKVDTKNLTVMNAPRQRTSTLYGTAIISADLKIKGTSNEPGIEGNVLLQNKSSIHYLLSQTSSYSNKEGLVQFVDIDTLPSMETEMHQTTGDSLARRKNFKGLNYNLNLEINKDAEFSIIIDPSTHDELMIKGEGQLNAGVGEGGAMGITGLYELKSGYYKMNNQILKGKFVLVPGSMISFNGDPNIAQADVKTQYEVKTTVSGLLPEDESSSSSSQRIPFLVILKIKGPLAKPEFSFDIQINEKKSSINSQLKTVIEDELDKLRTDVSAMNKQAFSLLVMNHFTVTGQGDMSSSNISPDVALRQGMSNFLSAAMNAAAGSLIKGVDIDVSLNNYKSDNNSDNSTDVEVSVSKKMLNDRMTVTVGENVLIGDQQATNAQQYVPDVTSTYKLSKDGRYQVKAYLKNEYDAVVEGYFSETGVSFVIEMDYNKFKEIFQRTRTTQNH